MQKNNNGNKSNCFIIYFYVLKLLELQHNLLQSSAVDSLDAAVGIIFKLAHLQAAQPRLASRRNTVVMKQIPLALILDDTVVGGPANNRSKDDTLIDKRSVGAVAYGVA